MAGAAAGAALLDSTGARADDAVPPADNEWSQSLGAGVVDRPYGKPSPEQAGVIRRNVPWLPAGTESSISFSPLQSLLGFFLFFCLFFVCFFVGCLVVVVVLL